ncbi:MAG: hypothetical protein K1Y36_25795 [Blastocatellia bacterium]|nr:hypothetical protein [Blastocatellia bacterium]
METLILLTVLIGINGVIAKLGSLRMLLLGWAGGIVGGISGFGLGYIFRPSFTGIGQLSIANLMELSRQQNASAQMNAMAPFGVETIVFIIGWSLALMVIGAILGLCLGGLTGGKKPSPSPKSQFPVY